ncbi:hypothetical protein [Flavisphingomonas formosensis]|uniref:hypothetical protein n=1 Tax=Flavisphingomonas formosensis TaxID=861534 RepID=UPI0012FAA3D5|nr:hypothetical protein [Sphingomonas formosensis]
MEVKKRPTALLLATAYAAWQLIIQPIWNLNVENLAQQGNVDKAFVHGRVVVTWLSDMSAYVPSSFGLGFVCGSLLFAYWDALSRRFRKHVLKRGETVLSDEPVIRAWLGNMVPHFDHEESASPSIYLTVLNFGAIPFKIRAIEGFITLSHDNGNMEKVETRLPHAFMNKEDMEREVPPNHQILLKLIQPFPPSILRLMPDIFKSSIRPYYDFTNLKIILCSDIAPDRDLRIWESMRLTTGAWSVRGDETFKMFKTPEERKQFVESWTALTKLLIKR